MNVCTLVLLSILITQGYSLLCAPGSYNSSDGSNCYRCSKGHYNAQFGQSKCNLCPIGNSCYNTDQLPKKCPKGQYQDRPGQQFCKHCSRGQYNVHLGQSKCSLCPLGHSCYNTDQLPTKCSKGQYQDQPGQKFCKFCSRGQYNVQLGQSKCNICPIGHSCYNTDQLPEICPKGQYQDQKGQRFCKHCSRGEYNVQLGQSKCNICPIGHSCYNTDQLPKKCAEGEYQDQKGQRFCKHCSRGEYNVQLGQSKCNICPAGSACPYVDRPPVPCSNISKGSYSPAKSTKCFLCPHGSFCPSSSRSPVPPSKNTVLKNEIKKVVKYAAEAYLDNYNPAMKNSSLIDSNNKVRGFVRYKGNAIVVAFRGTVDTSDFITNVNFLKTAYRKCKDCKTHRGFLRSYNSVYWQMLGRVSALSHAHPNSKVIVTGHSLGGALATLAAVDLAKAGYNTDLITYGSPRVGNKKFSEYVDKTLKSLNLRVTYKDDIVTVVPPQFSGYRHVGQEMHYTDQNTLYRLPLHTDVNYGRLSKGDHKLVNYKKLN